MFDATVSPPPPLRRRLLAWADERCWSLSGEVADRAHRLGVGRVIIGPMREDNPSRHAVRHGASVTRVYGLYATGL